MADRTRLPAAVIDTGIIAVARSSSVANAIGIAQQLAAAGVRAIELTLTIPGLLDAWTSVVDAIPEDVTLGVGTITTPAQAAHAIDLGVAFLVTPVQLPDVLAVCVDAEVPVIGGALTPSEIFSAWEAGASAVKVFPAGTFGPDYITHVRAPFPDLQLVPSGGIALDTVGSWIRAGAAAVCLGTPLVGSAGQQSPDSLRQRAAVSLAAVEAERDR